MQIVYRKGPMGSLMDEYERAFIEFKGIVDKIGDTDFLKERNTDKSSKLHSIKDICSHVIRAGYIYSNSIRKAFQETEMKPEFALQSARDAIQNLDLMFTHTLETVKEKYNLTDDQVNSIHVKTSWADYSLEGILEHAITHILRHRRQIEVFLSQ